MSTRIVVDGNQILVNGIQYGLNYFNHAVALREARTYHKRFYPNAEFIDIKPSILPVIVFAGVLIGSAKKN